MTDAYQLGATILIVAPAIASNVTFTPPRGFIGGQLKINSGGGTLAIVNAPGASTIAGYFVGATEVVPIEGPATFFLAATGATMNVGVVMKYSAGFSAPL